MLIRTLHDICNKHTTWVNYRLSDFIILTEECVNIIDRVSKRTSCFIGWRVEDLTESGDTSKRWFHREQSAAVSWIVNWAASVRTKGTKRLVGLDDDGATSWWSACEVTLIDWVLDCFSLVSVQSEWTHAHFVHVGRTNHNSSSIAQLFHRGWVDWSDKVPEDCGGGRGLKALGEDVVFNSNRDAIKTWLRLI